MAMQPRPVEGETRGMQEQRSGAAESGASQGRRVEDVQRSGGEPEHGERGSASDPMPWFTGADSPPSNPTEPDPLTLCVQSLTQPSTVLPPGIADVTPDLFRIILSFIGHGRVTARGRGWDRYWRLCNGVCRIHTLVGRCVSFLGMNR